SPASTRASGSTLPPPPDAPSVTGLNGPFGEASPAEGGGGVSPVGGGAAGPAGSAGGGDSPGGGAGGGSAGGGGTSFRAAHCPSVLPRTLLPPPTGAGSLRRHSSLPPIELPKRCTPPRLREASTFERKSLSSSSTSTRLSRIRKLPWTVVPAKTARSPTRS